MALARQLSEPNECGGTTDHSEEIAMLRQLAGEVTSNTNLVVDVNLAADLLEAHDQTGISLDDWPYARRYVERFIGRSVLPNCI